MKQFLFSLCLVAVFLLLPALPVCAEGEVISLDKEKAMEKIERYIEVTAIAKIDTVFSFMVDLLGLPTTADGCADGTYKGASVYDNYKFKHVIKLKIKEGKITSVKYDEVVEGGRGKRDNRQYNEQMKAGSGVSPAEAYPQYEKKLLESQDIMKVDAVTGATYSLYRFRSAAVRALDKARKK